MIVVPRPSAKSRVAKMKGLISEGGISTHIFGVWAQKLDLADLTRKWCSGSTGSFDLPR